MTLSCCQLGRPSRTATAIFVSKRMRVTHGAHGWGAVLNAGAADWVRYWRADGAASGGDARALHLARVPPAQPRDVLVRRHRSRRAGVHLPERASRERRRDGDDVQPGRPARRARGHRRRLHLPDGAHLAGVLRRAALPSPHCRSSATRCWTTRPRPRRCAACSPTLTGPASALERQERMITAARLLARHATGRAAAARRDNQSHPRLAARMRSIMHDYLGRRSRRARRVAGCSRFAAYRAFPSVYGLAAQRLPASAADPAGATACSPAALRPRRRPPRRASPTRRT